MVVKKILKVFFVYLLPLIILINCCTVFVWNVEFTEEGQTYNTTLGGFPFPDRGHFRTGYLAESDTNGGNLFLNQSIVSIVAFGIYFFFLRKINFESKKRSIVLTVIVVFIYARCGIPLVIGQYFILDNPAGGKWPDKIEVKHFRYINPLKTFIFRF